MNTTQNYRPKGNQAQFWLGCIEDHHSATYNAKKAAVDQQAYDDAQVFIYRDGSQLSFCHDGRIYCSDI